MRFVQTDPNYARLLPVPGGYALESTYNRTLVDALKDRIPYNGRKWDAANKRWIIAPAHVKTVVAVVRQTLGIDLPIPAQQHMTITETRLIKLEYLGRCKVRGDESTASGYADGGWTTIWPETVLKEWFGVLDAEPDAPLTLYGALGIKAAAGPSEIKAAYRRMAKQWHPDVCKEDGAAERFKQIQAAYEVLSDPMKRKKYDAGLAFERSQKPDRTSIWDGGNAGYRSPLRCGYVLAEGQENLGRFIVSRVLQWEDVIDDHGRVMVSYWPLGSKTFEVRWS